MKVTMNDDTILEGESAQDIVRQMKLSEWSPPRRKGQYMEEVASRVGDTVRTDDAETFLFDLERIGLLRIENLTDEQADRFTSLAINFRATTFGELNLGRSEVEEEGPHNTPPTVQMPQDDEEPEPQGGDIGTD
jgi:hypothetical protein